MPANVIAGRGDLMKARRALLLATLLLCFSQGCSTSMVIPPKPLEISSVRVGMNRTDVLNLLGLPNRVEKQVSSDGAVSWTWTYSGSYGATTVFMPGRDYVSTSSEPSDSARIVWSPDGTVRELRLPAVQR